jgi:hypothetical protein
MKNRTSGSWGYTNMHEVARQLEAGIKKNKLADQEDSKVVAQRSYGELAQKWADNDGGMRSQFRRDENGRKVDISPGAIMVRIDKASQLDTTEQRQAKIQAQLEKESKQRTKFGSQGQTEEEFYKEQGWR